MNAESFFDSYAKLEHIWRDFLDKELSYRNSSALGMTALRICYYVVCNPNCSLKEIALSLEISLGSASQMVQAMTVGGLLTSIQSKDDRRRISIAPQPVTVNFFTALC